MGWPPFDPHAKLTRELVRRAESALKTRGVIGLPPRGDTRETLTANIGLVFIYKSAAQLMIRYRIMSEPGQPYKLVYTMRLSDRETIARFTDLLEISVKELRQHQILDDLANA